ncbi:MAG: hypothetical protein HYR51_12480 [Candidatus Rokubacteria bacterium]|nr:hypothetical protein [Candidatus Rokubacteria bacterium]
MAHQLGVWLVAAILVGGCATIDDGPSAERTTIDPAWPTWFRLDWALEPESRGTRRITGYVHNDYGEAANEVQLLTQALDASGTVVHQRIEWVMGKVPPLSRTYFEVRNLPAADQYRVSVWRFSLDQAGGWM